MLRTSTLCGLAVSMLAAFGAPAIAARSDPHCIEPLVGDCRCDIDGDGDADQTDVGLFDSAWNEGDPAADFNADGQVDSQDQAEFMACVADPPPGCSSVPPPTVTLTTNTVIEATDSQYDGSNLIVRGCTVTINGAHQFATLSIERSGSNQPGVVTHSPGQSGTSLLVLGSASIDAFSRIDLNGRGFGGSQGPRAGASATDYGAGGGHGGSGGVGAFSAAGGGTIGSLTGPVNLGSGGGQGNGRNGAPSSAGGPGGGAIHLIVGGTLNLQGSINANGLGSPIPGFPSGGGGAGGSIWIDAATIEGAGTVTAHGGTSGAAPAGGGGGGRIVIFASNPESLAVGARAYAGGGTNQRGGAGTVILQANPGQSLATLILDGGGTSTGALTPVLGARQDFAALIVVGGANVQSDSAMTIAQDFSISGSSVLAGTALDVAGSIFVSSGSTLTMSTASGLTLLGAIEVTGPGSVLQADGNLVIPHGLDIVAGGKVRHSAGVSGFTVNVVADASIGIGSSIDLAGRGFGASQGPRAGASATDYGAGGGHGGSGGVGAFSAAGGGTIGSLTGPVNLGSGGGQGNGRNGAPSSAGGPGGGAIHLIVGGTLNLQGSINANGLGSPIPGFPSGGGGAGGSIWIDAATIEGAGTVTAHGGTSGAAPAGGGGGGRIAVYSGCGSSVNYGVLGGGMGANAGQPGTLFQQATEQHSVAISEPPENAVVVVGHETTFRAAAPTCRPPYQFTWSSTRDGVLGAGQEISVLALSTGSHQVSVQCIDGLMRVATASVDIQVVTEVDLQVVNLMAPPVAAFGQTFEISYSVANQNGVPVAPWVDRILLSTDPNPDDTDVLLAQVSVSQQETNGTYSRTRTVTLPQEFDQAGVRHLIVLIDAGNAIFETDEGNNVASRSLDLLPTPSADLVVQSINSAASIPDGQPTTATWAIRNAGSGSAGGSWVDRVYLSTNGMFDGADVLLGQFPRPFTLAANSTYPRSQSVPIAAGLNGTYRLVVVTDADNSLVEPRSGAEANNIGVSAPFEIFQAVLPNLVAINGALSAAERFSGETAQITWRSRNIGEGTTNGTWVDRVYLSTDESLDPASDAQVAQAQGSSILPPSGERLHAATLTMPASPGNYFFFVVTDVTEAIREIDETDNALFVGSVLVRQPEYAAVIDEVSPEAGVSGQAIAIRGHLPRISDQNMWAPNAPAVVAVRVRGTERTVSVNSDGLGRFVHVFSPLAGEAGVYSVSARHPAGAFGTPRSFTLYGMRAGAGSTTIRATVGETAVGQVGIANAGDAPLTGITYELVDAPANVGITVQGPTTLGPLASGSVSVTVTGIEASGVSVDAVTVRCTSAQGASAEFFVYPFVAPQMPVLVAEPGSISATMVRGQRSFVEFSVRNVGGAPSGLLNVVSPDAPWLSLVSPDAMPSLEPGQIASVTMQLDPTNDLPLGQYSANVTLQAPTATTVVPCVFTAASSARLNMTIRTTDEFTYFAEGAPLVAGARVIVRDAISGDVVQDVLTGASGVVVFEQLMEAYYDLEASAPGHGTCRATVLLGETARTFELFLPRQVVSYTWSVVPTTTEDRYEVRIETTFETHVPAPVITIEPALVDLRVLSGNENQVNFTVTNHGLIAAEDVNIVVGDHPRWRLEPLLSELGDLPAMTSVVVPVRISDLEPAGGVRGSANCVDVRMETRYAVLCGRTFDYEVPVYFIQDPNDCGLGFAFPSPPPPATGCCGDGQSRSNDISTPDGNGQIGQSRPTFRIPRIAIDLSCLCPFNLDCLAALQGCTDFGGPAACMAIAVADCYFSRQPLSRCMDDILGCFPAGGDEEESPLESLECIKDLAEGCLCETDFSPGDEDGLRGAHGLLEPLAVPTADGSLRYFVERANRLIAIYALVAERFGDPAWLDVPPAGRLQAQAWLGEFSSFADETSESGQAISEGERTALMSIQYSNSVSEAAQARFLDRWNRTILYWSQGIFTVLDVPIGESTDFIDQAVMDERFDVAATAVLADINEGYQHLGDSIDHARALLLDDRLHQEGGVCARVTINLNQEAVITRDAFRATLTLENSGTSDSLTDIGVDVMVEDASGQDVTGAFGIYPPEVAGLGAVDGTGTLGPQSEGSASWLIVPTDLAAPTEPVVYYVSGVLRYSLGGEEIAIPLFPAPITVLPNASLELDYFLERDVYSDDPFTGTPQSPIIEPAIPFSLGLITANRGAGIARNFRITSAQPEIIENDRGLLIDFTIIGTQVGLNQISPSLTANFGDLLPSNAAVARWLMTASLQGEFVEYSATFRHLNSLGIDGLSLIDNVQIHEMEHVVRAADGPAYPDDLLPDFLANDTPDIDDLPDHLYLSSGAAPLPVAGITSVDAGIAPTGQSPTVPAFLDVDPDGRFMYIRFDDPSLAEMRLASVQRSDGRQLIPGFNFWQTRRIVRPEGEPEYLEARIHLFDRGGDGLYALTFAPIGPVATDSDGDGTPDSADGCPNDPNKSAPGVCGCGRADADADGDGTLNCNDGCPNDPAKTAPGACGCGVADGDTDSDGTPDCRDGCPTDPGKSAPGVCGCGAPDIDSDGDGVLNCLDGCPLNPAKVVPGACGCDAADADADFDQVPDCVDNCPGLYNPGQQDTDHDGVGNLCQCPCDFDGQPGVDSQDYFEFIGAFFVGNADINGYDGTDSQDFFDFVECFVSGCP